MILNFVKLFMLLIVRGRLFQILTLTNDLIFWQTDFLYRGRYKLLDCLVWRDLILQVLRKTFLKQGGNGPEMELVRIFSTRPDR